MKLTISPLRIVISFASTVIVAILLVPHLSLDLLNSSANTNIQIDFSLPNSSADVVEQQATAVLENALSQLSQLKHIESSSHHNSGHLELRFDRTADMLMKQLEVSALVRRLYPQLPTGTSYPFVAAPVQGDNNNNNQPFLVYTISAHLPPSQLKQIAAPVFYKALSEVRGISKASVSGPDRRQIIITYDHAKCVAWHIDPLSIAGALRSISTITNMGTVKADVTNAYFIQVQSSIHNEQDIENLLLPTSTGRWTPLKEVATVSTEEIETSDYYRINGKNTLRMSITAREGENKIALATTIRRLVVQATQQLPAGTEVRLLFDDARPLSNEMHKDARRFALALGILLALLLLIYRNWRPLMMLTMGLVMNFALIIILTWLLHVPIHLYTVSGMVIAFGIMISNAVTMIDCYRKAGRRSAFLPLLTNTLIMIAALVTVPFITDNDVQLVDFSVMMIIAVSASLPVALWFTPALYDLFMKNQGAKNNRYTIYYNCINWLGQRKKWFSTAMLFVFGLPLFWLPARWDGDAWYHRWYNASLGSNTYRETIKPVVDQITGGTVRLFANSLVENSGYRQRSTTKLLLHAKLPYGHTASAMNQILSDFESYLQSVAAIDRYVTSIPSGQWGSIEISFKKGVAQHVPHVLKSRLIARSMQWGGVEWSVIGVGTGFSNMSDDENPSFKVDLTGYNYDELNKQLYTLMNKLKLHRRVDNVRIAANDKEERAFVLLLNDRQMALHQTSKQELLYKVAALSRPSGPQMGILLQNKYYPVLLKEQHAQQYSGYDLLHEPLAMNNNKSIRVREIGVLDTMMTTGSIRKIDREYIETVSFDFLGSHQFGGQYLDELLKEVSADLPLGYTIKRQDSDAWNWETNKKPWLLLLVLPVAIYFLTAVHLGSLRRPLVLLASIPVAYIGAFVLFGINNFYFDQGGQVGLVLLPALALPTTLLMLHDYHTAPVRTNESLIQCIVNRSFTGLLCTAAVCCSLLPFLAEGVDVVFWFSLATVITGGMLASLFINFVFIPVLLWKRHP